MYAGFVKQYFVLADVGSLLIIVSYIRLQKKCFIKTLEKIEYLFKSHTSKKNKISIKGEVAKTIFEKHPLWGLEQKKNTFKLVLILIFTKIKCFGKLLFYLIEPI